MGKLNRSEVNFKIMAFKGTAGKSSSGASMSKYDVEVEERLQKLEGKVNDISVIEAMVSSLETKIDALESQTTRLKDDLRGVQSTALTLLSGGDGDDSPLERRFNRLLDRLSGKFRVDGI